MQGEKDTGFFSLYGLCSFFKQASYIVNVGLCFPFAYHTDNFISAYSILILVSFYVTGMQSMRNESFNGVIQDGIWGQGVFF